MSEMIERVAKALAISDGAKLDHNPNVYLTLARAAIEAMRRPTESMFEATDHICERTGDELEIYTAFIEAALK